MELFARSVLDTRKVALIKHRNFGDDMDAGTPWRPPDPVLNPRPGEEKPGGFEPLPDVRILA